MKRRYPLYLSDLTDAIHMQTIASVFFMFFACITPIVTFGGLMGDKTDQYMVRQYLEQENSSTLVPPNRNIELNKSYLDFDRLLLVGLFSSTGGHGMHLVRSHLRIHICSMRWPASYHCRCNWAIAHF